MSEPGRLYISVNGTLQGIYDLLPQRRLASAVNLVAMEDNGLIEIKGLNKMHVNTEEKL